MSAVLRRVEGGERLRATVNGRPVAELLPLPNRSPSASCGWVGILAAQDTSTRAQRLETLSAAAALEPLPVDERVAHAWATLRRNLREAGQRLPINDSWIAATAIANDMAVASQDADYDTFPASG
ncbi:MAG: PIN domain-containing protein [Acidimicrobiales bacterium]